MTKERQIDIVIAESLGWSNIHNANTMAIGGIWRGYPPIPVLGQYESVPNFTRSYDKIIPLIQKLKDEKPWSSNPSDYPCWMFSCYLLEILKIDLWDNGKQLTIPFDIGKLLYMATPLQLCEAYLKALKMWKEEYKVWQ